MKRPRLRAGVALLFVFALGVLLGMAIERHHRPLPSTPPVAQEREETMAELRDVLELDEEQVARIETVLAEHQEVVERMWEQLRPEVQAEMRQVHVEIAELLRPKQRERFHEWLMRRLEQSRGRHERSLHER